MAILQCHQRRFGRPHHQYRERHGHHGPQYRMQPQRWREAKLDPEGERYHDRAEHQNDTDSRAVTGVMRAQIEIADLAAVANVQQTSEQPALPAAWATAGQHDM